MKPLYSLSAITLTLALSHSAQAATVQFECNASGQDQAFCEYVKQRFTSETPHDLKYVEFPTSSSEKLGVLQQIFASHNTEVVDVFMVDVVWPGILNNYLMDLTDDFSDLEAGYFSGAWQNNVINGRLKAIPAHIDTGMLLYRRDLLKKYGADIPTTWTELTHTAERIQQAERVAGQNGFWGLVFQGKAYEGLTCDALEWVASYGGGTIVNADGEITINNTRAAQGLDMAASWIGSIAPRGVMGYQEEEARAVFQNGDALFMRNWPYAYLLAQGDDSPIKGKVGIAPLPKGGEDGIQAAALGGWSWAVSRYSEQPEAAKALVRILSDRETQIQRFLTLGVSPTLASAYSDARILDVAPHMASLESVFKSAVARPASITGKKYAQVSNAFYNSAFSVLNGDASGTKAVADLEKRLQRIKRNQW